MAGGAHSEVFRLLLALLPAALCTLYSLTSPAQPSPLQPSPFKANNHQNC